MNRSTLQPIADPVPVNDQSISDLHSATWGLEVAFCRPVCLIDITGRDDHQIELIIAETQEIIVLFVVAGSECLNFSRRAEFSWIPPAVGRNSVQSPSW